MLCITERDEGIQWKKQQQTKFKSIRETTNKVMTF